MRAWMLAALCGAIIVYGIGRAPPQALLITLGVSAAALLIAAALTIRFLSGYGRLFKSARLLVLLLTGLLVGSCWAGFHAFQRLAEPFPESLEQVPLLVSGYNCSVPSRGAWNSVRQDFCVTSAAIPKEGLDESPLKRHFPVPARLKLSRYNADSRYTLDGPAILEVSLKRPHGSVNPDGFRYESWLFRHGFTATGTIRDVLASGSGTQMSETVGAENPNGLALPECGVACHYHWLRTGLVQTLNRQAAGMEHLGLVESLFLGSRGQLEPEVWETFRATGTSHLIAISGLHVGLVATMAAFAMRFLLLALFRDRYGPAWVPGLTFAVVCLAAVAYALLAGFTVPTQRALVMVVVGGGVLLSGAVRRAWDAWLLAMVMVIALDPFAVLDMGFWLSFGAVACLILAFAGRVSAPSAIRSLVLAQLAITLGLWPILTTLGIETAPLGFVANLFAIPWLSLVIMPLMFLLMPLILYGGSLGGLAAWLLDTVLAVLWWVLSAIAGISEGWSSSLPALPLALILLIMLVGFLALLPVGHLFRLTAVSLTAAFFLKLAVQIPANTPASAPQVVIMDVGQGLAVLLRDGSSAALYDTGPAGDGFSAAESQILPTLAALGVENLQLLMLSHSDGDHAGRWQLVAERLKAPTVISGEPEELGARVQPCFRAEGLRVGRWRLQAWRAAASVATSDNGRSCVIEAVYGRYRVALTGDIGLKEERAWVAAREHEPVDLLVAPHHGSASSSGAVLVSALTPAYSVFSAGYRNRYGHPHPAVVERYREQGAKILEIAKTGALTFTFSEQGISFIAERDRAPFWIRPWDKAAPESAAVNRN